MTERGPFRNVKSAEMVRVALEAAALARAKDCPPSTAHFECIWLSLPTVRYRGSLDAEFPIDLSIQLRLPVATRRSPARRNVVNVNLAPDLRGMTARLGCGPIRGPLVSLKRAPSLGCQLSAGAPAAGSGEQAATPGL